MPLLVVRRDGQSILRLLLHLHCLVKVKPTVIKREQQRFKSETLDLVVHRRRGLIEILHPSFIIKDAIHVGPE